MNGKVTIIMIKKKVKPLATNENIIESTNSNLFICDKGVVFTPPLEDGCVDGSMRKLLLSIIKNEYDMC